MTTLHDTHLDDPSPTEESDGAKVRRSARAGRVDSLRDRPGRSSSAQRALDRRRRRVAREGGSMRSSLGSLGGVRPTGMARVRRVPFVVPVIALLALGLGLSLWLSTKAAQDSYRLGLERAENRSLEDRRDSLKRTFESGDSAPELSDKAVAQGMIPATDPARMIIGPDGKPRIVGKLTPAAGKPAGSINAEAKPDPLAGIDKSKVDDSNGLGGDSGSTTPGDGGTGTTATGDSAAGQTPAAGGAAPAPAAPGNAAPGNAAPTPPAAAGTPNVAPNVLPGGAAPAAPRGSGSDGNPPTANSEQPR